MSYFSQDSSEDNAFVVWNRSSVVGPDMFVVLPRCGLQSESAYASVCDNSTRVNKSVAAEFRYSSPTRLQMPSLSYA